MHCLRFPLPPLVRRHPHKGSDDHTGTYHPDHTCHIHQWPDDLS